MSAFASILADGRVVAWGPADMGGDISAVQERLVEVQDLQSTNAAFAALRRDGQVVCWGNPTSGGEERWADKKWSFLGGWVLGCFFFYV